jgi:hypothetical protein
MSGDSGPRVRSIRKNFRSIRTISIEPRKIILHHNLNKSHTITSALKTNQTENQHRVTHITSFLTPHSPYMKIVQAKR